MRHTTTWFGILISLLAMPALSQAQERISQHQTPDLPLWSTLTLDTDQKLHWQASAHSAAWLNRSTREENAGLEVGTQLLMGWRKDAYRFLHLRSDLAYLQHSDPLTNDDQNLAHNLRGSHTLHARWAWRSPKAFELAIDAQTSLQHSGTRALAVLPANIGPDQWIQDETTLRILPVSLQDNDFPFTFPISYKLRNLRYLDSDQIQRVTTHTFSSSLGAHHIEENEGHILWEAIGVHWSLIDIDPAPPTRDSTPQALIPEDAPPPQFTRRNLERIDLHLLKSTNNIIFEDDDLLFLLEAHVGGAWIWRPQTEQEHAQFTANIALSLRAEEFDFSLAATYDASHTPDGKTLLSVTRFETNLGYTIDTPLNPGFNLQLAQQRSQHADDESRHWDQSAIHSAWFLSPTPHSSVGFYHLARLGESAWNLPTQDPYWSHELGAFLKWTPSTTLPF